MRNIFLAFALTICGFLFLGLSTSAQDPRKNCQEVVNGQLYNCQPVQSNGCIQNPGFNTLFPISPYQFLKQYHGDDHYTRANPLQTPASSWDCKVASLGSRFCIATYGYHNRRMSNVYMADTGQVVRCFWNVKYREDQENMGTLLAKGTTMYPGFIIMNGVRFATQVEGGTYPVNRNEFDCCQLVSDAEQSQLRPAATKNGELFRDFTIRGMLFVRTR